MFSGTTGVSFMAEMQHGGGIQLDVPVTVELSAKDTYPAVFQFTPTKDISSTQLDITVTSESDDVPAYLKVSRDCKDVKENIDDVDYKGGSLRLSFAKKGRITLSKFSTPPLTASTSSWFIGIAIKNASGDTPINARKKVTLTLKRSFAYSYTLPMWIVQCVICILIGLAVSIWAWYNFREYPCVNLCEIFSAMPCFPFIYLLIQGPKTFSYITFIVGSVLMVGSFQFVFADWYLMIQEGDRDHCYYNDFCYRVRYADIPYNLILSNLAFVLHGLILAVNVLCMESEVYARYQKITEKHTRENAGTGQNENGNKKEGNNIEETVQTEHEDKNKNKSNEIVETVQNENENKNENESKKTAETSQINYEKLPGHALWCPDISLHLEDICVPSDGNYPKILSAEAKMKKFSFSIPYAFAWALCFEGMFSALYHLCPSKLAFQFDTAFMFVMASLSVMLMYNGIETTPCTEAVHAKRRVEAATFFLFFLVPIFVLNYSGTMYHSEAGLTKAILFFLCLCLWMLIIAVWVLYKLCPKKCADCCKCLDDDIIQLIKSNEKAYQTWRSNKDSDNSATTTETTEQQGQQSNKDSDNSATTTETTEQQGQQSNKDSDNSATTTETTEQQGQQSNKDSDNSATTTETTEQQGQQSNKDNDNQVIFECSCCKCCTPNFVVGLFCGLGFFGAILVMVVFVLVGWLEVADAFLYLCLGESALVAVGSFLTSSWLKDSSKEWRTLRFALKGIFGFVVVAIMIIALHFFIDEATTDKSKSPEKSRDLNKECAWANFFDDHDKWHILSSFGLFMGALMLIHLSYKLPKMSSGTPPEPKSRPPQ